MALRFVRNNQTQTHYSCGVTDSQWHGSMYTTTKHKPIAVAESQIASGTEICYEVIQGSIHVAISTQLIIIPSMATESQMAIGVAV